MTKGNRSFFFSMLKTAKHTVRCDNVIPFSWWKMNQHPVECNFSRGSGFKVNPKPWFVIEFQFPHRLF